jgi:hypothetical protein
MVLSQPLCTAPIPLLSRKSYYRLSLSWHITPSPVRSILPTLLLLMLCNVCSRAIFTGERRGQLASDSHFFPPFQPLHASASSFLASVEAKCSLCTVLWKHISEELRTWMTDQHVVEKDSPIIQWTLNNYSKERFSMLCQVHGHPASIELNWDSNSCEFPVYPKALG